MESNIYTGLELGAKYSKSHTIFKVWSPNAEKMKVVIYDEDYETNGNVYDMSKDEKGIWELKRKGDYKNKYYNYRVTIGGIEKEIQDPYTKGATVNSEKGMIVDFEFLNPEGWHEHQIPTPLRFCEMIIYEIHVRDFSIDINSGIKNKGKYLAFTEKNTKGINEVSTGINHLKELGITHIHLMPIFDFQSVDESKEGHYNWGYDPCLYFVPEGSYSSNPYKGGVRITEFKEMIKVLHENNIRAVMDVVFNHTYKTESSPFDVLVPKYYYRTYDDGSYSNGSGCGNEIASEKTMVRKFIVDCVKFWASEYKIDGFRFDLMALHDIETMKQVDKELRKINPNILIYGEPWTGGCSALDYNLQFTKGKQKGTNIALFNDEIRNAIKGDNSGFSLGFVNGASGIENEIKKGIVASINYKENLCGFAKEPIECINYVSCHDNLTLFDKFEKSNGEASFEERKSMSRLALSIILTSQGIPFLHGGSEFLRSKQGIDNSYNAEDYINKIDWNRKNQYLEIFNYIKELIAFRKSQRIMTLDKAEDIIKYLHFIDSPKNTVAYVLNSPYKEDYNHIAIFHNGNREEVSIKLPLEGQWKVIANEFEVNRCGIENGCVYISNEVKVGSLSSCILCSD